MSYPEEILKRARERSRQIGAPELRLDKLTHGIRSFAIDAEKRVPMECDVEIVLISLDTGLFALREARDSFTLRTQTLLLGAKVLDAAETFLARCPQDLNYVPALLAKIEEFRKELDQ